MDKVSRPRGQLSTYPDITIIKI